MATQTLEPSLPDDVDALAGAVAAAACAARLKLVTAESCTGGLLASVLTDVEGCAHAFERGFVAYTHAAKAEVLRVPRSVLDQDGAVSAPAARAMAQGALAASKGDMALAVTGFAGPAGPDDEPGLVFLALACRGGETRLVEEHFGDLGRGGVRLAALRSALELLRSAIGAAERPRKHD